MARLGRLILAVLLIGISAPVFAQQDLRRIPPETGRDPFRLPEELPEAERPPGLAGVRILEVLVRGVVLGAGAAATAGAGLTILESPSGDGFVVGIGARLMDGRLEQVLGDGVVFRPDRSQARGAAGEVFRPLTTPADPNEARR